MTRDRRQIIAMGGGSFSTDPDAQLERYVLAQIRKPRPAVCFIPTATGDADAYVAKFYATFSRLDCRPSHLSFFTRTPGLRDLVLSQDVIYVGGGNTKSMLAVWHDWGLPPLLRRAWRAGTVLTGVSAGAICWFAAGVTDSWAARLAPLRGLGLLPGTCCPHYDGEADRRPALRRMVSRGTVPRALALDDGAAAHFRGRRLVGIVTSRPAARACLVERRRGEVVETTLPVRVLRPAARSVAASPGRGPGGRR